MTDNVAQYLIQFGAITAGAMGLAEWFSFARIPWTKIAVGIEGKTRKRINAWLYSFALGGLGAVADLVVLPGDDFLGKLAGLVVISTVAAAAGHYVHAGGRAIADKVKG